MRKEVVLYGTMECDDTVRTRERFEEAGLKYSFIDILSSLSALKAFLNIRDANPEKFTEAVKRGGVGIPIIVVNGVDVYTDADVPDPGQL